MALFLRHLVIDDFLPTPLHQQLLHYTLAKREAFSQSRIYGRGEGAVAMDFRRSWMCAEGLGPLQRPIGDILKARRAGFARDLGMAPFVIKGSEFELVAHRDGCFFKRHIDTMTRLHVARSDSDRIVSAVYYFHAAPKMFSGGQLSLSPLGEGEPVLVEPRDNRLVVFASYVPHEVLPVTVADDRFEHARFAINYWIHREKSPRAI